MRVGLCSQPFTARKPSTMNAVESLKGILDLVLMRGTRNQGNFGFGLLFYALKTEVMAFITPLLAINHNTKNTIEARNHLKPHSLLL